jgi:hypothetical protein
MSEPQVLVEVITDAEPGREIGWGEPSIADKLARRIEDIRVAMQSGASAIAGGLPALEAAEGWQIAEVSAQFGVTLTAEAGALITKASAGATVQVTVKFQRGSQ